MSVTSILEWRIAVLPFVVEECSRAIDVHARTHTIGHHRHDKMRPPLLRPPPPSAPQAWSTPYMDLPELHWTAFLAIR